jgi:RNA polymerase sigma-70 factor (ECF subfamily)
MMAAMALPAMERTSPNELDRPTLLRCKGGDPIAFRAFVVRYERSVFALLSRLLGRGPEVEDLAQETFLRAYRALPRFDLDGAGRPSTWLLTIATRLALDSKKKKKPELAPAPELVDPISPERETSRRELRRAITQAIDSLSDDQRAAFVLAEFHGFSIEEIASAVGVAQGTVKTRLFRAREKLSQALGDFQEEEA